MINIERNPHLVRQWVKARAGSTSLAEAQATIEECRIEYLDPRPRRDLAVEPPSEFARAL